MGDGPWGCHGVRVGHPIRRITDLEARVKRLEDTNNLLLDQFRRWQYNAYANNVRMDLLALDKPLPEVNRSGRRKGEKKKRMNSEQ